MKRFWGFLKVPNSKAMEYGKKNESKAIAAQEQHLGCKIEKCGFQFQMEEVRKNI